MSCKLLVLCLLNIAYTIPNTKANGIYSKSITLTSANTFGNGANVTILNSHDVKASQFNDKDYWNISISTQIGYHLLVSLNDSWRFNPNSISTIEVSINGTGRWNTKVSDDFDILVTFSVNSAQYVTLYTRLDNKDDNVIYPWCGTTSDNVPVGSGNIKTKVDDEGETSPYRCDKALNDQYGLPMQPEDPVTGGHDNEWPLLYKLVNDPIENVLNVSYTNPIWQQDDNYSQHCSYQSFDSNYDLNIFIAGDDQNEVLSISTITVKYSHIITDNPTNDPSTDPTIDPTADPTYYPTNGPTNPTNKPTNDPSIDPTNLPSNAPTCDPTPFPSKYPTTPQPAITPTTPKPILAVPIYPTTSPTKLSTTTNQTSWMTSTETVPQSQQQNNTVVVIVVISVLLCMCCCLIVAYWRGYKHKKWDRMNKANDDNHYVQLVDIDQSEIEGSFDVSNNMVSITRYSSTTTTTTGGEQDGNDTDGHIYNYSKSTPNGKTLEGIDDEHDIDNEKQMDNDSIAHSDIAMDLIPAEKNTAGDFEQILGDKCLSNDLMMDDIINDIETRN